MAQRTIVIGFLVLTAMVLSGCSGGKSGGESLDAQYRRALQTADPVVRVSQLLAVAGKQRQAGDMRGAEQTLAAATDAGKAIEGAQARAASLNRVAAALARMDRPGETKNVLREVSKTADEIEDLEARVPVLSRLAYTYGKYLEDLDIARSYLKNCESLATSIPRPEGQVQALLETAVVYYGLELTENSQALLDQSLQAARDLDDGRKRADALADAAATFSKVKQDERAKEVFQESQQQADAIEDPLSRSYALVHLGQELNEAGLKSAAQKIFGLAEASADQVLDQSMRGPLIERIYAARRGS